MSGLGTRADTSYQIVGVVRDFPGFPPEPGSKGTPAVYHPAAPGDVNPLVISVRAQGRHSCRIHRSLSDDRRRGRSRVATAAYRAAVGVLRAAALLLALPRMGRRAVTNSVLLLSAAGIYAMMSFTVAQRTREIAIRTALGAAPHRLLLSIFGRATRQLALGLLVGSVLSAGVFQNTDFTASQATTLTLIVAGILVAVGLIAALGPARRGLRIQASEALRADG